jgi:DNA-binding CsgD family transcriptional regulator
VPAAELEVISTLIEGCCYAEMAKRRGTSERTIANQIAAVFKRLNVSGHSDLIHRLFELDGIASRPATATTPPPVPLSSVPPHDGALSSRGAGAGERSAHQWHSLACAGKRAAARARVTWLRGYAPPMLLKTTMRGRRTWRPFGRERSGWIRIAARSTATWPGTAVTNARVRTEDVYQGRRSRAHCQPSRWPLR